jgi:hypothetical protein
MHAETRERERKGRERKEREIERGGKSEREKQKQCFRERNFPLTFDKNSSEMTTNAKKLRSVRNNRKI